MARGRTERLTAHRFEPHHRGRRPQEVVVEEPLEIRLGDRTIATTMRTPGHDVELAVGWLWAEGLLGGPPLDVRFCATAPAASDDFNVVTVDPGPAPASPDTTRLHSGARMGLVSSSEGTRGTDLLDAAARRLAPLPLRTWPVDVLAGVGDALADRQELFSLTGGAHGAAAFDRAGDPLVVREDVGRHNAIDKVVGRLMLDGGLPATGLALWTSGRVSFEMVRKAWSAGFGALVSVSAPSSLAVEAACRAGMVLVGFARDGHCTVYAGEGLLEAGPQEGPR